MRKFFLLQVVLFSVLFSSAQTEMLVEGGIKSPFTNLKRDLSYSNYKSYYPYVLFSAEVDAGNDLKKIDEKVIEELTRQVKELQGSDYNLNIPNLNKTDNNSADFKILTNIIGMISSLSKVKDTGYISTTTYLNVTVLDKAGKIVFDKTGKYNLRKYILGMRNADDLKSNTVKLKRMVITEAISITLQPFVEKYFQNTKIIDVNFMTFATSFRDIDAIKKTWEVVDSLTMIAAQKDVNLFSDAVKKYVPFWESLTTSTEGKKPKNINRLAYHNLGMSYLVLKDTAKANEYFSKAAEIEEPAKFITRAINRTKNNIQKEEKKQTSTATIHPESMQSVVKMEDLKENISYKVIKGEASTTAGVTESGIFKIKRPAVKVEENNIVSLDVEDHDVVFIKQGGEEVKTSLSKYKSFRSDDNIFYLVQKPKGGLLSVNTYQLYQEIDGNTKASAYLIVFPDVSESVYYKKAADAEVLQQKLFGNVKSTATYFSDCPDLSNLIKEKELDLDKDYKEILSRYKDCN